MTVKKHTQQTNTDQNQVNIVKLILGKTDHKGKSCAWKKKKKKKATIKLRVDLIKKYSKIVYIQ